MSKEIIIVTGLMGVGKSTFAKEFAEEMNYVYFDFDNLYHKELNCNENKDNREEFCGLLSTMLEPDKNYIIDNWFRWCKDWNLKDDKTLQLLENHIDHEIMVMGLFKKFDAIKKQYQQKEGKNGNDTKQFFDTMEQRTRSIFTKILNWVK